MGGIKYSMTTEGSDFNTFLEIFKTMLEYDDPNLDMYYKIKSYDEI